MKVLDLFHFVKISYKIFYEISFYSKSHQSPMNDSIGVCAPEIRLIYQDIALWIKWCL